MNFKGTVTGRRKKNLSNASFMDKKALWPMIKGQNSFLQDMPTIIAFFKNLFNEKNEKKIMTAMKTSELERVWG